MKCPVVAVFMFQVCDLFCLAHGASDTFNVTKLSTYAGLTQEIMSRDVIVHKISPEVYTPKEYNRLVYRLVPIDVVGIDDVNQLMTVRVFIQISWLQRNLSWNPTENLAIDVITLETKSIWLPNIVIISGEKGGQKIEFPEIAQLHSDGKTTIRTTTYITFRCNIDFDKYPFDSQECHFGFYLDDNPPQIDVVPWNPSAEFRSDSYAVAGEWYILDFSTELFTDLNNASWPRYRFKVKRRSTYYVITVVFPLILTSAMIPLVFLMPPENGEKVSYLVAVFTSTAIFLNFISDVMPRSLSSMPFLAFLLLEVIVQSFGAILATLHVINKFKEELLNNTLVVTKSTQKESPSVEEDVNTSQNTEEEHKVLDKLENTPAGSSLTSRQLDRLFFVFFCTIKIIFWGVLFGVTEWLR